MQNRTRGDLTSTKDIDELHRHFPKHTHDEVAEALEDCRGESGTVGDYGRILECIKSRLTPQAADGVD